MHWGENNEVWTNFDQTAALALGEDCCTRAITPFCLFFLSFSFLLWGISTSTCSSSLCIFFNGFDSVPAGNLGDASHLPAKFTNFNHFCRTAIRCVSYVPIEMSHISAEARFKLQTSYMPNSAIKMRNKTVVMRALVLETLGDFRTIKGHREPVVIMLKFHH